MTTGYPDSQQPTGSQIIPTKWETKTLKLAKMAFIGQEIVRKHHRHNSFWGLYTLIAVYVHCNRFIDLTIHSNTNPYNVAAIRLWWIWVSCAMTRRGTFHLHGKTGKSSWKISWLAPFRLGRFRNRGQWFEAMQFSALRSLLADLYIFLAGRLATWSNFIVCV